ncbi:hypothetical protein F2Q69_00022409 [Brassica cretica]|uniref:Uncharacterized protein n=1 Tax=Brassica cretica TaxID=69181 RepID=A0A8S9Q6B6_BRACR|nr:hypothetical protein F2Q69_00022409 [Brassica cretica]
MTPMRLRLHMGSSFFFIFGTMRPHRNPEKLSNESFKERRTPYQSSLANGRSCSPSWTQDGYSSAVRRDGPKTDSAQPFAELDKPSLTNGRAGSTETLLRLVLVTPLLKLHRTHSCFVSIGGIVGTLQFKNRGNSSFLEGHSY